MSAGKVNDSGVICVCIKDTRVAGGSEASCEAPVDVWFIFSLFFFYLHGNTKFKERKAIK